MILRLVMMAITPQLQPTPDLVGAKLSSSHGRKICALLFFATTINYMDRATIGILKPTLMADLAWSEAEFGDIVSWFSLSYAIGYALAGRAIDLVGVRLGYAIAVAAWSAAAMGHGLARSVIGFTLMRSALGLAEGGNFPAAVKAVSETFPRRQQAVTVGLFNAGSNMGMIAALLLVPSLTKHFGWPSAFFVTGATGFVWVVLWWRAYGMEKDDVGSFAKEQTSTRRSAAEGQVDVTWLKLLAYRQVWAFIVGMALCSPIWWFFLFWSAGFLYDKFGVDLEHIGWPLVIVYLTADVGSIGGGWLSGRLMRAGWTVNAARKTAMLVCAFGATPVVAAAYVDHAWMAVALLAMAAAANQGFAANLFSIVSDTVPRRVIGSVIGLGGMAAGLVAAGFQRMTGRILDAWPDGYVIILGMASSAYLVALLFIHVLSPRLEPMERNAAA
jgi:ACS family hexuronate transporter-like MFS transporter